LEPVLKKLYDEFVSYEDDYVDYKRMANSDIFKKLVKEVSKLRKVYRLCELISNRGVG